MFSDDFSGQGSLVSSGGRTSTSLCPLGDRELAATGVLLQLVADSAWLRFSRAVRLLRLDDARTLLAYDRLGEYFPSSFVLLDKS